MATKKIVCLGGASSYFVGVLCNLVLTEQIKGSEIILYDIDTERAELMAKCGQKLSDIAGADFKVQAVKNLTKAIDGADFAIANIGGIGGGGGGFHRQGGIHEKDLLISAKYGIYQVVGDTGGPAAMMAGLRTIPVYLDICRKMEKLSPDIVFINHANPMAILCRAINKYSNLKDAIGICHGVQGGIRYAAEVLNVSPEDLDIVWIGTNHYYWFTEIYCRGKDVYPKLKKKMAIRKCPGDSLMHAKLSGIFGYQIVYPDDSHIIEFYPYLTQIKAASHFPYEISKSSHGVDITKIYEAHGYGRRKNGAKEKLPDKKRVFKDFAESLEKTVKGFSGVCGAKNKNGESKKSMSFIESLGSLIGSIATGERKVHIVNIPNRGVVSNLPATAVLELEGVTDCQGVRGIHVGKAPVALKGQLEKMIAWQEIVVDAGVKGDKNLALQALMLDPMAILPEKAEAMLDELLANSKKFLPQFSI